MRVAMLVARVALRSALAALIPHAGRASSDDPQLGRVRWTLDPAEDALLLWASDRSTCALARIPVVDLEHAGEVEQWDTTTGVVRKILAVFKASSTRTADLDDSLRIEVTDSQVHLTEAGGLIPGEHLKVPRLTVLDPDDDRTVDVPKVVAPYLSIPPSTFGTATLRVPDLAAFSTSARAYGAELCFTLIDEPFPRVLVQVAGEPHFLGLARRCDDPAERDQAAAEEALAGWQVQVEPLKRPEKVHVPADIQEDVVEQLRTAFTDALHNAGPDLNRARFTVIRDDEQED